MAAGHVCTAPDKESVKRPFAHAAEKARPFSPREKDRMREYERAYVYYFDPLTLALSRGERGLESDRLWQVGCRLP